MPEDETQEKSQPFRVLYRNEQASSLNKEPELTYIAIHQDGVSGKDVVLWEDILFVFNNALTVRRGAFVVPFLKDSNLKSLDPRRIQANHEIIYDVILEGPPKEILRNSTMKKTPSVHDETIIAHEGSENDSDLEEFCDNISEFLQRNAEDFQTFHSEDSQQYNTSSEDDFDGNTTCNEADLSEPEEFDQLVQGLYDLFSIELPEGTEPTEESEESEESEEEEPSI
ncbi:hypothetical protein BGZ76_006516 [Entomortierella beljakovae]|nr:hypothetical protein BGZ76_006516 [Entomortierella beljakovae]